MKQVAAFMLCVAMNAAPIVYTEHLELSGYGFSFAESSGGIGESSFAMQFFGSSNQADASLVHSFWTPGFAPGPLGRTGFTNQYVSGGIASIGGLSSQYYEYDIRPIGQGGYLRLKDPDGNLLAEAPVAGRFYANLIEQVETPNLVRYRYATEVVPSPEPASWILMSAGIAGLMVFRRKVLRRN